MSMLAVSQLAAGQLGQPGQTADRVLTGRA